MRVAMEAIKIADEIIRLNGQLKRGVKELQPRNDAKAVKAAEHDKDLAIWIIKLKTGKYEPIMAEFGLTVDDMPLPATIIERVAKGLCWKSKLEADKADGEYKNAVVGIEAIKAQLNGNQSIYRHLEEV